MSFKCQIPHTQLRGLGVHMCYRVDFDDRALVPVFAFDLANGVTMRERILRLEEAIRLLPPGEAPVRHHFSPGIYAREMLIPAGTVLTGKIHRHAHLNIISQGDISVLTEHGVRRLRAPCTLHSSPGIKRAGYAHTDTVWTTIHATDLTDLDALEREFIVQDYAEWDALPKPAEDRT